MRIRIRRWWRRDQHRYPTVPAVGQRPGDRGPERPGRADAPTARYDTADPARPYVIRECDG
jgi:hypothetical protein